MQPLEYTYDDLCAAALTGYSRGRSDLKRGPRKEFGVLIDLFDWMAERCGKPCRLDPSQICEQRLICEAIPAQRSQEN